MEPTGELVAGEARWLRELGSPDRSLAGQSPSISLRPSHSKARVGRNRRNSTVERSPALPEVRRRGGRAAPTTRAIVSATTSGPTALRSSRAMISIARR